MDFISDFIIIDDDEVSNNICKIIITTALRNSEVILFSDPESGFEYIGNRPLSSKNHKTILLLDINMPSMTGWEFLSRFERLEENTRMQYKIYILSSSVDIKDKEHAGASRNIKDYIVKPLTHKIVYSIASGIDK